MPLALLADLKARLEIAGTGEDAVLTDALNTAGGLIDQYLDRTLVNGLDIVEFFDGGASELRVRQWPIRDVIELVIDPDGVFAGVAPEVRDADYRIIARRGRIRRLPDETLWPRGAQHIRVTYRGGYCDPAVPPGQDDIFVPEHIQQACLLQATELWNRHKEPGYKQTAGLAGGMSAGYAPEVALLPAVKELLRNERRG